jgi:hypothetical protein
MSHERFTDASFESKWQPGVQPEFHSGEYKPSRHKEEKNVTDRINHINMTFTNMNMPVVVFEMPESKLAGKPEPKNLDRGSIVLDIIEMIFEAIGKMAKAILPKGKR